MSLFNNFAVRRRNASKEENSSAPTTLQEYERWWREAANSGVLFRITREHSGIIRGQLGEPYCYVWLAEEQSGEGETFDKIAQYLYNEGFGAILCREGWSPQQTQNLDCLWLSYGSIVDYRQSGKLYERTPASLGWGVPGDGVRYFPPGLDMLLPQQRMCLHLGMQAYGIERPRVILQIDQDGRKSLVFNINDYITDRDRMMRVSALINWFLPRYYFQAIYDNASDITACPVLPFAAGVEEDVAPEDLREEMYRAVQRTGVAYDADAISSHGERQWRERAASSEIRFLVDPEDIEFSQDDTPHMVFYVAALGEKGYTFREAALLAADRLCGALLCGPDWSMDEATTLRELEEGRLVLSLGDLVDFLMTGNLERRRMVSGGWFPPKEWYTGRFVEPDSRLLPSQSRWGIVEVMKHFGISKWNLSLQVMEDGRRLLYFSGYEFIKNNPELHDAFMEQIRWCLPRHYTFLIMDTDSEKYIPWPILQTNPAPSSEVLYLGGDEEEDGE